VFTAAAASVLAAAAFAAEPPLPPRALATPYLNQPAVETGLEWRHAQNVYLATDRFDVVKSFYQKRIARGDTSYTDGQGLKFFYRSRGPKDSIHVVEIGLGTRWDSAATMQNFAIAGSNGLWKLSSVYPGAFGELAKFIDKFGHTKADFNKLLNRYAWVYSAYYKRAGSPPQTEDSAIFAKHYTAVYGVAPTVAAAKTDSEVTHSQQYSEANATDMAAAVKSGDMSALMSSINQSGDIAAFQRQTAEQQAGVAKDYWGEWVKCLEELDKAAFATRITVSTYNTCNPDAHQCPSEGG
jgi:hypothetical protein